MFAKKETSAIRKVYLGLVYFLNHVLNRVPLFQEVINSRFRFGMTVKKS